jgi:hypothetical protein
MWDLWSIVSYKAILMASCWLVIDVQWVLCVDDVWVSRIHVLQQLVGSEDSRQTGIRGDAGSNVISGQR